MRTRLHRSLGGVALLLLVALGGSGCSAGRPFVACPAIGYLHHVEVVFEGPGAPDAARLVLCSDRGCSVPSAESASLPPTGAMYVAEEVASGRWRVGLDLDTPGEVTLDVFDATGILLARAAVPLEWRRIDGSAECGGHSVTDPVVLVVG